MRLEDFYAARLQAEYLVMLSAAQWVAWGSLAGLVAVVSYGAWREHRKGRADG